MVIQRPGFVVTIIAGVVVLLLVLHVVFHPIRSLGCVVEVIVGVVLFAAALTIVAALAHR